ncbi:MAG: DUF616 domain-containing protein, partial [Atopobiaceae bacterium]|nr:DUF616 domain-containing protein [Atopobiaceae bacterium]
MFPKGEQMERYAGMLAALEMQARMLKRGRSAKASPLERLAKATDELRATGIKAFIERRQRVRMVRTLALDAPLPQREEEPTPPWMQRPECWFCDERIAVYMAMFGGYDTVPEPVIQPDNVDYFLISDAEPAPGSLWTHIDPASVVPQELLGDPVRSNRWCKMHPHLLFPEHALSIYFDSNILIASDPTALAYGMEREEAFPVAMFRHKNRDCVYDEILACVVKGKAPFEALEAHKELLRAHGVPRHHGLLEAPVIVRRHNDPRCIE